jgi:hypothetical protein
MSRSLCDTLFSLLERVDLLPNRKQMDFVQIFGFPNTRVRKAFHAVAPPEFTKRASRFLYPLGGI